MKIFLLISEGGRANNYLANKISKIEGVKISNNSKKKEKFYIKYKKIYY